MISKEKLEDKLNIANKELAFQNKEKEKRADELIIAKKELLFQNKEKEKRAAELVIANKELVFQNEEKEKRADELVIANIELDYQNEEKEKRADELISYNKELVFQNEEKEKRANELVIANIELDYQNEEKDKRADELIIYKKEQVFKNEENEKRTKELSNTNIAQELDITERKRTEIEIKLKNEQLEKLNAEKDKFFSIIAHDLKSPFTGFLGLTEMMVKDMERFTLEDFQNFAGALNLSANNLFRLLTNLLEWSTAQRGLTDYNPCKFSLKKITRENFQLFNETAKKKGVDMEEEIPEDIFVMADKSMLNSVIRNLISNALKFTKKGGRISISTKNSEEKVEISITDTGIGMGDELVKNLFKIDKKTSRKGTDDEPSTGLGLLLCKEFIEKHNGKITIVSEEGKGSEFVFSLPGG